LDCSGEVVGLPEDQMGNSEVGHLHIGSGRFVFQDLSRVNKAIREGEFFNNSVLCTAVDQAVQKNKALHIMGLLSDGGVHSHDKQILAMVELAAKRGLKKIYLHAFLDGRDVPPKSAAEFLTRAENRLTELGAGRIVSLIGRFYAMDRDKRWERVEKAYQLIAEGQAERHADTALQGLELAYQSGETDEFVIPTLIGEAVTLDPEDSVVFMNFRADRAREISQALTNENFKEFERHAPIHRGYFATLTEYHQQFTYPVAYPTVDVNNGLGEVLAKAGLTQLRLAETEKYAHVTFFLNGGRDEPFVGESRILVPSPKVKTYDLQPEMSSAEVTQHLLDAIYQGKFDVIICNYANCDMVGHTGQLAAAIQAVETIDQCLEQIVTAVETVGGQLLLTADHGNIEQMLDEKTGQPHTAHTMNPVPLLYIGGQSHLADGGSLADLAPTILDFLAIPQPSEMTGRSLRIVA
ncbi:MAG: hypothetical protein RL637_1577, partial [Pseudomonadota bacterium]